MLKTLGYNASIDLNGKRLTLDVSSSKELVSYGYCKRLKDVRSSLIVVMTLLLTPLITFIAMNYLGISANLMSLGGLTIAIGLMVDGSVVVVENTFHRLGHDKTNSKLRVVLESATEVGKPVLFGVGIIILVFIPLMTLTGMEGKMFSPLAVTIAIALYTFIVPVFDFFVNLFIFFDLWFFLLLIVTDVCCNQQKNSKRVKYKNN